MNYILQMLTVPGICKMPASEEAYIEQNECITVIPPASATLSTTASVLRRFDEIRSP